MEKTITIQRNKVFFSIFLSIFLFSAFFLNYLNVSAADCGGCGQPACPVTPPPTSPPHTSPPVIPTTCTCKACSISNWCSDRQYTGTGCPCRDTCSDHCECGATLERCRTNRCTCAVRYSDTPCADTCRTDPRCSGNINPPPYNPPSNNPPSNYVPPTSPPPTSPPPTCQIMSFTINGKDNSDQNPLIVWVNALLKGYFSVNDVCKTCTVSSSDNWNGTYPISTSNSSFTESFKINTAGTYSYILECVGTDPEDIAIDTLSLQTVKAINLPWWREIIPNLGGFLRGI
jgi:hypothetical protein